MSRERAVRLQRRDLTPVGGCPATRRFVGQIITQNRAVIANKPLHRPAVGLRQLLRMATAMIFAPGRIASSHAGATWLE